MADIEHQASDLRQRLCAVGQSLFERGYVHATAGNLSARLADGSFLITPTDACLGRLSPQQLAHVAADGTHLAGATPSKTWMLHRRIYEASENTPAPATCVIHTHSTHLVAASLLNQPYTQSGLGDELLPPITPYFVMKVGHVPHLPYHMPGAAQVAEQVAQAIARYAQAGCPIRAVMLARLGPNVWHTTPEAAMATLEELEETARLWLLTQQQIPFLEPAHIAQLKQRFNAHW